MLRGGWMGTILRVDLNKRHTLIEKLGRSLAYGYIGGRGLNLRMLYDEIDSGVSPLSSSNVLILSTGPFNGTLVPGSSRFTITAKSPLSNFIGDTNCGGSFGAELKYAGYDSVVIRGKSRNPVYLWINDGNISIGDASNLWGKTTWETERILKRDLGDSNVKVISIGPAGENLVRSACIIGDLARAAGRGLGAVMGSKNLKAVAVSGTNGVRIASPRLLEKLVLEIYEGFSQDSEWYENHENFVRYGAAGAPYGLDRRGVLATKNYYTGKCPEFEHLTPETLAKLYWVAKKKSCFSCPLGCGHFYVVTKGPYKGTYGEGPQGVYADHLGAKIGNADVDLALKLNTICNQVGLDVMGASGAISFAMECYEKNILSNKDTDGLELKWGDHKAILRLVDLIVHKQGLGKVLAEGVRRASEIIGRGSERYAMHVKGLDLSAGDPRGQMGWALGYAVSSRGADHCRHEMDAERNWVPFLNEVFDWYKQPDYPNPFTTERKAELLVWHEDIRAVQDSLQICKFVGSQRRTMLPESLSKLYNAVTGLRMGTRELMAVGERITNLERVFNLREGLTRKDDTLPERFLKEPMPEGPAKGKVVTLEPMIREYYGLRGWNTKTGVPRKSKLIGLGLRTVSENKNVYTSISQKERRSML